MGFLSCCFLVFIEKMNLEESPLKLSFDSIHQSLYLAVLQSFNLFKRNMKFSQFFYLALIIGLVACNSSSGTNNEKSPTGPDTPPETSQNSGGVAYATPSASAKIERLMFSRTIDAPPETVFNVVVNDDQFRDWTSVFAEGSHFKGNWEQGSTMEFLSDDGKGGLQGMMSLVREISPGKSIKLVHVGLIQDGKKITEGPEVEQIKGAQENYSFNPSGNGTRLSVISDALPEMKIQLLDAWPKALDKIKSLAEGNVN